MIKTDEIQIGDSQILLLLWPELTFSVTTNYSSFQSIDLKSYKMPLRVTSIRNGAKKKILVLESEAHLRMLFKEELRDEGYQIFLAKNDKKALKMLKKISPDLMITEYPVAITSSYDELLHLSIITKTIPVIIYTGYPLNYIEYSLCGSLRYLTKSSNMDKLKSTVIEVLANKKLTNKVFTETMT